MAQTIKLKRSATSGATPTTSQLELGEVAINTYDGKMYIKKNVSGTESIVEIGGSAGSSTLSGLSDVTISSAAADQLLQYNGSEWVNVSIAEASAIMKEYQFTATSGQSTFSGSDDNSETLSYTAGAIQVFLNGIFLDSAVDYTATNGTSIVLSETVDANDYLQVVAFKKKIGDGNVSVDTFTGDDSTTAFTLSVDPGDENNTRVFIDGVYQSKSNYSVSGTTLTFSTAPPTGTAVEVEIGNRVVTLDTLSDLDLPDDVKLRLGTSQDLQIYHDSSHSIVADVGTGDLLLRGNNARLQNSDGSQSFVHGFNNGAVEIFHSGNKKFETTSSGIDVNGTAVADALSVDSITIDGTEIDSSSSLMLDIAGNLTVNVDGTTVTLADDAINFGQFYNNASGQFNIYAPTQDKDIVFLGNDGGSTITALTLDMSNAGKASFNHDIAVGGSLSITDSGQAQFGTGNDMQIYHNGAVGEINNNTGTFTIDSADDIILDAAGNDVVLKDNGTTFGQLTNDSGNLVIYNSGSQMLKGLGVGSNAQFMGNLGIGASPATGAKLHLSSTAGAPIYIEDSNATSTFNITELSNNGANFGLQTRNSSGAFVSTDYQIVKNANGADYHRWFTAGSERMRIDSSGNLLVGLSSSLTNGKLQIAGGIGLSGNTQIRQATNSDGNTLQVFATQLVAGSLNSSSYGYTGGGLLAGLSNLDGVVILDAGRQTSTGGRFKVVTTSSSNTSLYLEKNGTYTLYADTGSGNVGIGTSNPQAALHIYDTPAELLRMEGNDEYAYASFYGTVSSTAQRLGYMGFANDTSTAADFNFANNQGGIFSFNAGIDVDGNSSLGAGGNGTHRIGRLTVDYLSNSNPVLSSDGTQINFSDEIALRGVGIRKISTSPSHLDIIQDRTGYDIVFKTSPTTNTVNEEVIRFTHDLKVGIGTGAPSGKLHVNHGNQALGFDSGVWVSANPSDYTVGRGAGITMQNADVYTGGIYGIREYADWRGALAFYTHTSSSGNTFGTTFTEKMRISNDGKVGIGTTSPSKKLHVYTSDNEAIFMQGTASGVWMDMQVSGGNLHSIGAQATGMGIYNRTSSEYRFFITDAGNVGIGTTAPSYGLHVQHDDGVMIRGASGSTNGRLRFLPASGGRQYDFHNDGSSFQIYDASAGASRLYFHYNGNTGIGTTSPNAKLQVQVAAAGTASNIVAAGTDAGIYLEDDETPTNPYFVSKIHNPGNYTAIGGIKFAVSPDAANYSWSGIKAFTSTSGAAGDLRFYTSGGNTSADNSVERMRIDSGGAIRLGGSTTNGAAVISSCTSTSSSGGAGTGNYLELETMEPNNPNFGAKKLRLGVQGGGYVKMTMPGSAGLFIESPYQANDKIHVGYAGVQLDMNGGGFGGNQNMLIRCANDITFHPGGSERWRMIAPTGSTPAVFVTNQTTVTGLAGTPPDLNSLELGPGYINLNRDDTVSATQIQFGKNGSVAGSIVTTSSTTYNTTSDRRAKENITDAQDAGKLIDSIQVREFDWKNSGEHQKYGMVAQELLEVAPEVVHQPEDEEQMMGVDYSKLVPMLVKALQESRKEINNLKSRVEELESQ